jgi:hypothetical protein
MPRSEIALEIATLATYSFDAVKNLLFACVPGLALRFGRAEYRGNNGAVQKLFLETAIPAYAKLKSIQDPLGTKSWVNAGTAGLFEDIPEAGSSEDLAQELVTHLEVLLADYRRIAIYAYQMSQGVNNAKILKKEVKEVSSLYENLLPLAEYWIKRIKWIFPSQMLADLKNLHELGKINKLVGQLR